MLRSVDYVYEHAWTVWVGLALASALLELMVPYFAFIFAAAGALVAALVALRFTLNAQLVAFSVGTVSSLVFLRPMLKARRQGLPSRVDSLLGRAARVTVTLEPEGRVVVGDEDWAARARVTVAAGSLVRITGSDGITLLVEEVPE